VVNNRRGARRHPLSLPVDVMPILDERGQPWRGATRRSGVTLDVNERGVLCARVGYLPLGGVVRLFIRLPDLPEQPVACNARVVRCEMSGPPAYGLKLVGLALVDAARIQRYARARRPSAPSWQYRFSD
jgi:hypothetical protein